MTRSRALAVVAVIGVAIFALSFVNGWIVHDREIRGEGYRHSEILLSAWRSVAVPVLGIGVVLALVTSLGAVARLVANLALPGWLLVGGAMGSLAIVASSIVPLSWDGFTTSVDLRPAALTWVGLVLAAGMLGAAALATPPGQRGWAVLGAGGALLLVAAVVARQAVLTVSGPSNQVWTDGTYLLADGDGTVALVIADGRYRLGDRWAGAWEGSGGWTVALDEDEACPGSRGAYHARAAGTDGVDLRFVKIVDTCEDGARAEVLESGTWERQP
jgi:hypothetical protein